MLAHCRLGGSQTAPYTVPASGTFYLTAWTALGGALSTRDITTRAYINSHPTTGSFVGTEDAGVGACSALRYTHSVLPNNVTVRSAAFTAAAAPTKMKAHTRVKEVDAATAGTDYTLEGSRDGVTTWSTMTLTELFTSPSPTAANAPTPNGDHHLVYSELTALRSRVRFALCVSDFAKSFTSVSASLPCT
ncbi:hypothetical protein ABIB57_004317 [Devosia sp. UYZn731]